MTNEVIKMSTNTLLSFKVKYPTWPFCENIVFTSTGAVTYCLYSDVYKAIEREFNAYKQW